MAKPVRKLDLSTFVGDVWAADGTIAPPPGDVPRLVVIGPVVQWYAVPMDGMGDDAAQVADAVTTIDARAVRIFRGPRGQEQVTGLALASSFNAGAELPVPADFTEDDVSSGDLLALGIPAITVGTAAALWIYSRGGLDEAEL